VLFNSQNFIFIFLPTVILFYFIALFFIKNNEKIIIYILSLSSLFFYGYWNPSYIFLICLSIIFNYSIGKLILKKDHKIYFLLAIFFNLSLLEYFKYSNFIIENMNILFTSTIEVKEIELPLAISFFTFQQIAFLIDLKNRQIFPNNFFKYSFFILFFPQLIAGPIVRYQEMIPQINFFRKKKLFLKNLSIGITFFCIGLFKKNCLAYNLEIIANTIFDNPNQNSTLFFEHWVGVVAYSFQIYFDFSAYSDMAIGLARIFGFKIPMNFNSPYKSESLIEFWTRWHITLSRFIRDTIFTPFLIHLGRFKYINKFENEYEQFIQIFISALITFALSGLWHGASWNFVIWGFLHGLFLSLNYLFKIFGSIDLNKNLSRLITIVVVFIIFVPFRADNLNTTISIWKTIFGVNADFSFKLDLMQNLTLANYFWLFISFMVIFFLKNIHSYFKKKTSFLTLNFDLKSSFIIFFIIILTIFFGTDTSKEFIYFQF